MNEPNSIRHKIDLVYDRYEQHLHAGRQPRIEDALTELSDLDARPVLFRELLQLDINYAQQAKRTLHGTALRRRFPQYIPIIDELLQADDVTLASEAEPAQAAEPVDLDATIDPVVNGAKRNAMAVDATAAPTHVRYVGDYEILNEIARGGMGVVYRGRQTSLGRLVALKMILAGELAGKDAVARFHSEAEAAANLNHPGIVPIYEIGEFENQHYFSMGLIEGPSLGDRLREHPFDSRQAAELLQKVADAVDYAHQQGVIHRDLKPGNILLDAKGNPHVTDFGLAKRLTGTEELTTTGQVLGTPAYMPPEQARGDLKNIGPASDVYSLGAILYAAVCGRPPHTAGNAIETLKQVVEVEPVSVRSLNPSVPKDLETICSKCLAKVPADRYGSAGELSDELGRFLRGEPIQARPISRAQRIYRWAIRRPALASLLALVALLTATLAIGGPVVAVTQARLKQVAQDNQRRASALALQEKEARQLAEQSRQALALEKNRSDHALYARTISLAHQQIATGNRTAADDLLASTPNELRGFEYDYVNGLCHSELAQLDGMSGTAQRIAFAPDGVHVIASQAGTNPKVYVWDIESNQPQDIRSVPCLALSRDGSKVVTASPNDSTSIQVTDSITGEVLNEFDEIGAVTSYADLGGPGDSLFVCLTTDRHIRVWDLTTGKQLHAIEDKWRRNLFPIAISPDGTKVAYRRVDDGAVELKELKNNRRLYGGPIESKLSGVHRFPVEFHPDGQSFAVGGDGLVEIRSSKNGDLLGQLEGLQGNSYDVAYSPDGNRIAVTCQDESIRIYSTATLRLMNRLTGHKIGSFYGITAVAFDQTGNRIISSGADATVRVWDAWSGDMDSLTVGGQLKDDDLFPRQSADYLVVQDRGINGLQLSDDGSKLLVASKGRSVAVFDSTDGSLLRRIDGLSERPSCVDFDLATAMIVVGGGGLLEKQPSNVEAWDFRSGERIWESNEARGPISRVAFTDGGRRVVVGVGSAAVATGELFVLDAKTGEPIWKSDQVTDSVRDLAISPNGAVIASVGRRPGIEISDARTGKLLRTISDRVCSCVDFSRDGKQVAVGTPDWSVRVFDFDRGDLRWASRLHSGEVLDVQFSADDQRLVSVSIDGTARVWDNHYGDLSLTLRDDGKPNFTMAVSADGRLIAAAGDSRAIKLYRTAPQPDNIDAMTKDWVTLLEDSFEDTAWTNRWTPIDGQWTIVDGKLQATLGESQHFAGLKSATLNLDTLLPSMHEIAYDVQIEQPMAVVVNLRDAISQNAISAWFLGRANTPLGFNRNEKGVAIAQMAAGTFKEIASRRDGTFSFEPRRTYRLRIRRLGNLIQTYVDDQPYRSARVPLKTPIPVCNLLATFGNAGDKVTFDNLRITMPPDGHLEAAALEWVSSLFDQQSLKPLVIQHIESAEEEALLSICGDKFNPQDLRLAALDVATSWWQEPSAIVTQAMEMATDNRLDPQQFLGVHQWINENLPNKTEAVYRTLAAIAFRAGDAGQAWNHWGQCNRLHDATHLVPHPIDLAITALLQHGSENQSSESQKDGQDRARSLQQVMHASHWREEELAKKWAAEVAEAIPLPAQPKHHDVWAKNIWEATHDVWIQGNVESTARLLSPKFVYETKREPQQNAEVHSIDREPWLACMRLWNRGRHHQAKLTRGSVDVVQGEQFAVVVSSFVFELEGLTVAWQQSDTFTSAGSEHFDDWRLNRRVFRPTRIRLNDQLFSVAKEGWNGFDQLTDQQSDALHKISLLYLAGRHDEAFQTAIATAKGSDQASDFAALALAAFGAGDPEILQKAINRAIDLDPMVGTFPVLRTFATEILSAEKPVSIGRGVTCRPPSFFQPLPKRILGEDQGVLAVWQAADESIVAIFTDDQGNDIEKQADKFQASQEQTYNAKFLLRQQTTIAQKPAIELLRGGLGIGWAIAGGGKPTLQRFVLVQRDDHVLVCLVSAYADTFAFRDREFATFLNTIRFQSSDGEQAE